MDRDVKESLQHPIPRGAIAREIAKRFDYLRRVTVGEMNRALAPLGVPVPMYNVLIRLAYGGPLSQQELTLDAGLDAAGVSRLVARMAKEKLVTIKVDARDRRRRLVRLTPKGRALEEALSPVVDAAARQVVTGLTEKDEQALLALLDKAVTATAAMHAERRARRARKSRPAIHVPSLIAAGRARAAAGVDDDDEDLDEE
jgi:DNA-binding MarR family transcriptional regulator